MWPLDGIVLCVNEKDQIATDCPNSHLVVSAYDVVALLLYIHRCVQLHKYMHTQNTYTITTSGHSVRLSTDYQ